MPIIKHKLLVLTIGLSMTALQAQSTDSLECTGSYVQDTLKHGVWVCRIKGYVAQRSTYKLGKLINYTKFNAKGDIIETRNKKGKTKLYKPCGC